MSTSQRLIISLLAFFAISLYAIAGADPLINVPSYPLEYFMKQIQWYLVAIIAFYVLWKIPEQLRIKLAYVAYGILLFASAILAFSHFFDLNLPLTRRINGSTAWYEIPGIGTIQPSEFLKVALLIVLADLFSRRLKASWSNQWRLILQAFALIIPACLVTLLQNDTGVTMMMMTGALFLLVSCPLHRRFALVGLALLVLLGCLVLLLLVVQPSWFQQLLHSYRGGRIAGWLDPEGYYETYGYQLYNSILSYGGSGWLGHGFQSVIMPIPEPQTDFIYAIILQDAGFVGGLVVLAVITFFDWNLFSLAKKAVRPFHRYLATGMLGLLLFSQFWNIGMVLQVLPITGITLPFISYGGSSLLSYFILMAYLPLTSKAKPQSGVFFGSKGV